MRLLRRLRGLFDGSLGGFVDEHLQLLGDSDDVDGQALLLRGLLCELVLLRLVELSVLLQRVHRLLHLLRRLLLLLGGRRLLPLLQLLLRALHALLRLLQALRLLLLALVQHAGLRGLLQLLHGLLGLLRQLFLSLLRGFELARLLSAASSRAACRASRADSSDWRDSSAAEVASRRSPAARLVDHLADLTQGLGGLFEFALRGLLCRLRLGVFASSCAADSWPSGRRCAQVGSPCVA